MIQAYRRHDEITIRPLAEQMGISYSTLCRFENGGNLDAETLIKIMLWLLTSETETKLNYAKKH